MVILGIVLLMLGPADCPKMIILGVILLVTGFLTGFAVLWAAGAVLLVLGTVLLLCGRSGRMAGGRRHWY